MPSAASSVEGAPKPSKAKKWLMAAMGLIGSPSFSVILLKRPPMGEIVNSSLSLARMTGFTSAACCPQTKGHKTDDATAIQFKAERIQRMTTLLIVPQ